MTLNHKGQPRLDSLGVRESLNEQGNAKGGDESLSIFQQSVFSLGDPSEDEAEQEDDSNSSTK